MKLFSKPNLITNTDNFNWSYSDAVIPSKISVSDQSSEFHRFLYNFTRAKVLSPATPEQYWHLILNLQYTIQSYDNYILDLQSQIIKLQKSIKKTKIFYHKKINELKEQTNQKFICPVCLDPQTTLVDLDYHICKRHNNVYSKWNSLRCEDFNNSTSENSNDQEENQISNNKDNSYNELHKWMNNKFDYLENLIKKKKHHHHNNSDDIEDDDIKQSPKVTISNSRPNNFSISTIKNKPNNYSISTLQNNTKPSVIEKSPFHKSDKHILNLSESSEDERVPFNSPNKKIIQSNDDYNQFEDFNKESSDVLSNDDIIDEENEDETGHFVETIENNNNHSIFFSTNPMSKLRSKSEDTYN